ncbi:hypothetical protein BDD43_3705 [Mucilaginibacter gracilis]|uniref:Peptidase U49-like protein n=1 Tax=Mucilaginibacter gracilis TaxID=423350 RepID=A0A495J3D0_9SPHI|nr:hypothetical protein [Mucilaginibacter gracilis]RKR83495.1 hypothetical protein BDD43_3705 [Mucilaginibacter gracilis]
MYNYRAITDELVSSRIIPQADIYDYAADPIGEIYNRYFQYCQKALSEFSTEFNIQPAKIYFNNLPTVNAAAGMGNSYYVIKINKGLISTLYNLLYVNNKVFDQSELKETYDRLASSFDTPLEYVMYQLATYFTFYHERAHLVQKSPILTNYLDEINLGPTVANYSSLHHSLEFDADIDAAHRLIFVILEYWDKLPEQYRDEAYATEILALTTASIFTYFMYLEEKYSEIYYKEGTHPHPVIRITYILDVMIGVAQQNFQNITLDDKKILRQCLRIATGFCEAGQHADMVKGYAEMWQKENDLIEDFINNVLIPESVAVPCLIKNRR